LTLKNYLAIIETELVFFEKTEDKMIEAVIPVEIYQPKSVSISDALQNIKNRISVFDNLFEIALNSCRKDKKRTKFYLVKFKGKGKIPWEMIARDLTEYFGDLKAFTYADAFDLLLFLLKCANGTTEFNFPPELKDKPKIVAAGTFIKRDVAACFCFIPEPRRINKSYKKLGFTLTPIDAEDWLLVKTF